MDIKRRSSLWGTIKYMNKQDKIIIFGYLLFICLMTIFYINIVNDDNEKLNETSKVVETTSVTIQEKETPLNSIKEEEATTQAETTTQQVKTVVSNHKDFKSYMSYRCITDRSSQQWKLQKEAHTGENGIRYIDEYCCVAIGTGWNIDVGDKAVVTTNDGNTFYIIVSDIKDDRHTLSDNKTTAANGCQIEFIVDVQKLYKNVRTSGNISVLPQYSGNIVSINKI